MEKYVEKSVEKLDTEKSRKRKLIERFGRSKWPDGIPPFQAESEPDSRLPAASDTPVLHKIGVTKLIASHREAAENALHPSLPRSLLRGTEAQSFADGEDEAVSESQETLQDKRLPLEEVLPPPQTEMRLPAFLMKEPDAVPQRAAHAGTVTHIVLELLDLDAARACQGNMDDFVREQLRRMVKRLILSPEEAELVRPESIADFLCSPLGQRMLRSERVEREFSFTLKASPEDKTLVQGIIDLCFLENGGWVLVDFKTDSIRRVEELLPRYAEQISYYRRALTLGTDSPVTEAHLYSIRLGRSVTVPEERENGSAPIR